MSRIPILALLLAMCVGLAVGLGMRWPFNSSAAAPGGTLACSVKASCGADEVAVFRMSSTGNAHAGTPGGSSYGDVVCCGGVAGLGTSCSGAYDTVLTLSGTDNAHVGAAGYPTDVCLSGGDDATAHCTYGATCPADYACLATISGYTNAHVAGCDGVGDYATKVCCLTTPDNCPSVPNPDQANADGDQWGDACDYCPTAATLWHVPQGDDDCDGFTTAAEQYVVTDPVDACPDSPSDDAWPPDINKDTAVTILDVLMYKPKLTGPYDRRYDLDASGEVNILDVLLYKAWLGMFCTNP